jgi:hypothetical protein
VEKWKKHENSTNTTICGGKGNIIDRYGHCVGKKHPQMKVWAMWIVLSFILTHK